MDLDTDGPIADMIRANGETICPYCGRRYIDHPFFTETWVLDWEGQPFLHKLCNGWLVKL